MEIVIGVALIIVAGVLLLVRRSRRGRLAEIQNTPVLTARELRKACEHTAERLGEPGSFKRVAEVSGIARSDKPFISEMSRKPCLYSSLTVTREHVEEHKDTDPQTKRPLRKTRRGAETVFSNTRYVPFWVEDATGTTWVDLKGADVAAIPVVDRFVSTVGDLISLGGYSFDVGALATPMLAGRRILGYRFQESILPVSSEVRVLGEASDSSGTLSIRIPNGRGRLSISMDPRAQAARSAKSTFRWLLAGSITSGVAGVALVIAALVK